MIQTLITSLLEISASTWISANLLDGDDAGVRVYHQRIPQGHAYPAVVYNVLPTTTAHRHHIGTAATVAVQDEGVVQFDIWHSVDSEAATIAANLRTLLEGQFGTVDGINYNTILLTRQGPLYNDPIKLPGIFQEYNIRINL
jgi:hypothetical protein